MFEAAREVVIVLSICSLLYVFVSGESTATPITTPNMSDTTVLVSTATSPLSDTTTAVATTKPAPTTETTTTLIVTNGSTTPITTVTTAAITTTSSSTTTTVIATTHSTANDTSTISPAPCSSRNFDTASFIGGIILAFSVIVLAFIGYKCYIAKRSDTPYHQF